VRRYYKAFEDRDLGEMQALSHPEIELTTVTGAIAGREGPYRGHEGLERYLADTEGVWTRLELLPQTFLPVDEVRLLVHGRVRTWRGRGHSDSPAAWLWTIEDKLVRALEVFPSPSHARDVLARR
jgi:ketosteroid isomerase-like protein